MVTKAKKKKRVRPCGAFFQSGVPVDPREVHERNFQLLEERVGVHRCGKGSTDRRRLTNAGLVWLDRVSRAKWTKCVYNNQLDDLIQLFVSFGELHWPANEMELGISRVQSDDGTRGRGGVVSSEQMFCCCCWCWWCCLGWTKKKANLSLFVAILSSHPDRRIAGLRRLHRPPAFLNQSPNPKKIASNDEIPRISLKKKHFFVEKKNKMQYLEKDQISRKKTDLAE